MVFTHDSEARSVLQIRLYLAGVDFLDGLKLYYLMKRPLAIPSYLLQILIISQTE